MKPTYNNLGKTLILTIVLGALLSSCRTPQPATTANQILTLPKKAMVALALVQPANTSTMGICLYKGQPMPVCHWGNTPVGTTGYLFVANSLAPGTWSNAGMIVVSGKPSTNYAAMSVMPQQQFYKVGWILP